MAERPQPQPEPVPFEVQVTVAGGVRLLDAEAVVARQREGVVEERDLRELAVVDVAVRAGVEVELHSRPRLRVQPGVREADDRVRAVSDPGVSPLAGGQRSEHRAGAGVLSDLALAFDEAVVVVDADQPRRVAVRLAPHPVGGLADLRHPEHGRAVVEQVGLFVGQARGHVHALLESVPTGPLGFPDRSRAALRDPRLHVRDRAVHEVGVRVVRDDRAEPRRLARRERLNVPLERGRQPVTRRRRGLGLGEVARPADDGVVERRGRVRGPLRGRERPHVDETRKPLLKDRAVLAARDRLERVVDLGARTRAPVAQVGVHELVGRQRAHRLRALVPHLQQHHELRPLRAPGREDARRRDERGAWDALDHPDDAGAAIAALARGQPVVPRSVHVDREVAQPAALTVDVEAEVRVPHQVA